MKKIALLEKKELKRTFYATALNQLENIDVVVEAKNLEDLLIHLTETKVDLILYCWDNEVEKNLKPLEQLQKACPKIKILLLATHINMGIIFKLLQFKNCGYILEESTSQQLHKAITELLAEGSYFEPDLVTPEKLAAYLTDDDEKDVSEYLTQFTEKQKEIIIDVLTKKSSQEICVKNEITASTLRKHYEKIRDVTQTKSTQSAVVEIVLNTTNLAKKWGFKCLVTLFLLCNGIDFSDDNAFEDVESGTSYEWMKAG